MPAEVLIYVQHSSQKFILFNGIFIFPAFSFWYAFINRGDTDGSFCSQK